MSTAVNAPEPPPADPAPAVRPKWKRWLIDSALARILWFVAALFVIGAAASIGARALGLFTIPKTEPIRIVADIIVRIVPGVLAYLLIARQIERRSMPEVAWRRALPDMAMGFAGGFALISLVVATCWLAGAYRITQVNPGFDWARPLLVYGFATAVLEEIIFRGILFRILDETAGVAWALGISAVLFGAVHMGNKGATLWTSTAIAIEAGVLLGVTYHVTKSLWAVIGLHMSWNFLQGGVFGSAVSGIASDSSLLVGEFRGAEWLTGGAFGLEASVVTVLLSLAGSAALLAASRRRTRENQALAGGNAPC